MKTTSSKTPGPKGTFKKRSRPRPLRKESLAQAARFALAEMVNLPPKTDPINVSTLASRIGVTRQAVYNNNLRESITEHAEIQRKNYLVKSEAGGIRRSLKDRISALEMDNLKKQKLLDGWIEKWAAVEYNARLHGLNADLLFAPMPPPQRSVLLFRNART